MSLVRCVFPIKLNDKYTCQGFDANGQYVVFDDLLSEGDRVASFSDSEGNCYGPFAVVVRRDDGLWAEAA